MSQLASSTGERESEKERWRLSALIAEKNVVKVVKVSTIHIYTYV